MDALPVIDIGALIAPNSSAAREAVVHELDATAGQDDGGRRWDRANLQAFEGTYGDYVSSKVGKVFPELKQQVS
jgi:hypothetical protein